MKHILYFLLLVVFISCKTETTTITPLDNSTPVEIISVDEEINTFMLHPDKYTWEHVDQYYRRMVESNIDANLKDNLKNMTIYSLIEDFNLLDKANDETLLYYKDQYMTLGYNMNVENHAQLLQHLYTKSLISKDELTQEAKNALALFDDQVRGLKPDDKSSTLLDQKEGLELLQSLASKA